MKNINYKWLSKKGDDSRAKHLALDEFAAFVVENYELDAIYYGESTDEGGKCTWVFNEDGFGGGNEIKLEMLVFGDFETWKSSGIVQQILHGKKEKTTKRGLKAGWTRHSLIIHENTLRRLQNCAYTERLNLKDVVEEALTQYLEEYERTHEVLEKPRD